MLSRVTKKRTRYAVLYYRCFLDASARAINTKTQRNLEAWGKKKEPRVATRGAPWSNRDDKTKPIVRQVRDPHTKERFGISTPHTIRSAFVFDSWVCDGDALHLHVTHTHIHTRCSQHRRHVNVREKNSRNDIKRVRHWAKRRMSNKS